MRTEEEIRVKLSYLKGYLEAGMVYAMPDKEQRIIKAVMKELEWVIESEESDER